MKKAKWIGPNFTSDSFDKAQSILSMQYQQEILLLKSQISNYKQKEQINEQIIANLTEQLQRTEENCLSIFESMVSSFSTFQQFIILLYQYKNNNVKYIKKIYELSCSISKIQDKLDYYIRENINNVNSIITLQNENKNLRMQLISQSKEQKSKLLTLESPLQVISAYLSGIGWKQCDFLLASLNIQGLKKAEFYSYQAEVDQLLNQFVQKILKKNRDEIKEDTIITSDGSYNHVFGSICFNCFINFQTNHIIDYCIMKKDEKNDLKINQFEAETYQILLNKLFEHNICQFIKAIMTDGDSKLRLLTDQFNDKFGTKIVHLRDFVHGKATIQKIIKSIYSDMTVEEFPELNKIVTSLLKFSTTLIKAKLSPELNEKIFSNSLLHLSGKHSELCLHNLEKQYEILLDPKKTKLYNAIKKKVDKASKIFGEIDSNFTTNICENFFSIKSKLVPKNRFFGASSKSRFEIAILESSIY
ncbi:hypothetical protein M9Y10_032134 [Tritrichomonas musculus]|uniref:DUF4371 domain-containing protein n=1 Tax=Tritrichomonas musculus TaxID=1915356 RepID=A0ABR2GZ68_9EUKA